MDDFNEQAFVNGYSAGYEAGRRSAGERKTGRWIFKNGECGCGECGMCLSYDGNGVVLDLSHLPYCPHCGAYMRGTEDGTTKD